MPVFETAARFDRLKDANAGTEWFSLISALVCLTLGVGVLLGWANDEETLKRIHDSFVAMNPATAVCFIVAGFGLTFECIRFRRCAAAAGTVVMIIAAAKLGDHALGGLPVDRLLFSDKLDPRDGSFPNQMAPNTALAFLLAGVAQTLATSKRLWSVEIAQILSAGAFLISSFAVIGYAFSMYYLLGVGTFIPMALHTAVGLIFLSIGITLNTRNVGLMLIFRDPGPAGSMARTIVPLALAVPVIVGVARLWGQKQGYYSAEAGVALQVFANVVVTICLLSASIVALHRSDQIRRKKERALAESEHINRMINSASPDAVCLLDHDGIVVFANEAVLRVYNLETDITLIGRLWGHKLDSSLQHSRDAALAAARAGDVGRLIVKLENAMGRETWFESLVSKLPDDGGQTIQFIVLSRDITLLKHIEDEARWTATHDSLTRLPNRSLFQERLDRLAEGREPSPFALLLLDIDDFKLVNDTLGHDAGDALLISVADRLRRAIRPEDFIARLGGDEFAVILDGVKSEEGAASAGEKILEQLKEPWIYAGRVGDCRVSIGASIWPQQAKEAAELLKNADIALYAAKVQDRGKLAIFKPSMRDEMRKRSSKLACARQALDENLIVPYYQPKVELISGKLVGFEALLRWWHPAHGVQMPETIDAAFQDLELARQLTDRMLSHVLYDMRRWLDADVDFGHVAINITAADFKQKEFAELLLDRLDAHGLHPGSLEVEVTETVFLGRGAEYVEDALHTLSKGGIRIALDDFGTGYASLSHLKQFPVDIVKIDRSFLRDIQEDAHNTAIIRTVIALGRSLGLDVVAEGIETIDQQAYLIGQGCRLGQGYLYGSAAPAAQVPGLITSAITAASQSASPQACSPVLSVRR